MNEIFEYKFNVLGKEYIAMIEPDLPHEIPVLFADGLGLAYYLKNNGDGYDFYDFDYDFISASPKNSNLTLLGILTWFPVHHHKRKTD